MLKIKALFSKKKPDQADLSQESKKPFKGKTRSSGTNNKDVSQITSSPKKSFQDKNIVQYPSVVADDHHMKSLTDELVTTIDSDSSPVIILPRKMWKQLLPCQLSMSMKVVKVN